jgi:hypothetical protein
MIGFVTTQVKAQQVNDSVAQAQTNRGLSVFWLPGMYEVHHGIYDGLYFIPCDDETMHTPLRGNPILAPIDFPEFQTIIEGLGGLDARVDIPPSDIIE